MNDEKPLPKEFLETFSLNPLFRYRHKTSIVYLSVLCAVSLFVAALPLVEVDVTVNSPGLLRPIVEVSNVKIPSNGKVERVAAVLNQKVNAGDTLLTLDSTFLSQRTSFLREELVEDRMFERDLIQLLSSKGESRDLETPFYIQAKSDYLKKKADAATYLKKMKLSFNRNVTLHDQGVISDSEFEAHTYEFNKASNNLKLIEESQLSRWQTELLSYQKEIAEHEAQYNQIKSEIEMLTIVAPVSGTIESMESIHAGSQVFGNQDFVSISPDTGLIAEIYVTPSQIGLVRKDMPVKFQLDAFHYNQWGLAYGRVREVSADIQPSKDAPVFVVKCLVDQKYLQLKNGYKGYLRKGMTLKARFIIARRSLWDLIYDSVDDWVNPNAGDLTLKKAK